MSSFMQDLLMGAVAAGVGVFVLVAAVADVEWFFQLSKPAWLVNRLGRGRTRGFFALLGAGVIALGAMIACGMKW